MAEVEQNSWTAEEDQVLKTHHARGTSMRKIGDMLNRTRNSVIGRANRLGLKSLPLRLRARSAKHKAAVAKATAKFRAATPQKYRRLSAIDLARLRAEADRMTRPTAWRKHLSADRVGEPPSKQISFMDLEAMQCRYDSSMTNPQLSGFCGHTTKDRSAYCEYHHRKCYTPVDSVLSLRAFKHCGKFRYGSRNRSN